MGRRTATTPERTKARFLEELARGRTISDAARAAGIGRRTAYDLRQRDEVFAIAWADAVEEGTDRLIEVARERAVAGSDHLLMFLIKARRPEYRDSYRVEHAGQMTVASKADAALRAAVAADPELAAKIDELAARIEPEDD